VDLYQRNAGAITSTPGLCLVPKIKYEHINLTHFSKMIVDLAAQVCVCVVFVYSVCGGCSVVCSVFVVCCSVCVV